MDRGSLLGLTWLPMALICSEGAARALDEAKPHERGMIRSLAIEARVYSPQASASSGPRPRAAALWCSRWPDRSSAPALVGRTRRMPDGSRPSDRLAVENRRRVPRGGRLSPRRRPPPRARTTASPALRVAHSRAQRPHHACPNPPRRRHGATAENPERAIDVTPPPDHPPTILGRIAPTDVSGGCGPVRSGKYATQKSAEPRRVSRKVQSAVPRAHARRSAGRRLRRARFGAR